MAEFDRIKWDQRYAQASPADLKPPDWLGELDSLLPRQGYALDIATGAGRLALWLANRGLEVVAVDISSTGLELLRRTAVTQGHQIETFPMDLETDQLPQGPFDVITCFNYRQRDLFSQIRRRLNNGGFLLAEITTILNAERHAHPSLKYLAEPSELRLDCTPLEIMYYEEGWFGDRASARVVARK